MSYEKKARAFESLFKLFKQIEECRTLCNEAQVEFPESLRRVLDEDSDVEASPRRSTAVVRSFRRPEAPPGISGDWINVPLSALSAQTAVLAVLRGAGNKPLPAREIAVDLRSHGLQVSEGSIYNIGGRLERDRAISKAKGEGWTLTDRSRAPIISGENAWGTSEMFTVHELAARRRDLIVQLLADHPAGLLARQILAALDACDWRGTPLSKDLVKADLDQLQRDGRLRRNEETRVWTRV